MNELLLGAFAFAAGGVAAWLWRASLTAEALRRETERRAAAEAGAARVPGREAALVERVRQLAERGAKPADAFNARSAEALKSNSQAFIDLAKLGDLERSRIAAYSALDEQLRALVETHLPKTAEG